ncbi:MAG: hypothetical protein L6R28_22095 [Planctomycetes bacterium]|nr:hypothetical protein [Planctomycetota bacterium]
MNTLVGLDYKPDAEQACARMAAWWEGEILDRPAVQVRAPRRKKIPVPQKQHPNQRARWMDAEFSVDRANAHIANTYYAGELLPTFWPNLGPDYLAACLGVELTFAEDTSWSHPILKKWELQPAWSIHPGNPYMNAVCAMTRYALETYSGKFIVGHTDLHPGGDLASALRGPQQLCVDVLEEPERVLELMEQLRPFFYEAYDAQHRIMLEQGQTLTTAWLPLFAEGRYYIPSNDFSCMVSPEMFKRFFLTEIEEEVRWLDRSIYHLDGPQAVRHLDALLAIEKLDAVQYVYGAGARPATKWLHVYKRIQDAGKNLHVAVEPHEIKTFMENLRPDGVMLSTWAESEEHADAIVAQVAQWPRR